MLSHRQTINYPDLRLPPRLISPLSGANTVFSQPDRTHTNQQAQQDK